MVEVPSSSDNSEIEQVPEEREVVVERVWEASLDVEENLEDHLDVEAEVSGDRDAEDPDRPRVDLDEVPFEVSTMRGSGELSCSYRHRVPIHLYFYEGG